MAQVRNSVTGHVLTIPNDQLPFISSQWQRMDGIATSVGSAAPVAPTQQTATYGGGQLVGQTTAPVDSLPPASIQYEGGEQGFKYIQDVLSTNKIYKVPTSYGTPFGWQTRVPTSVNPASIEQGLPPGFPETGEPPLARSVPSDPNVTSPRQLSITGQAPATAPQSKVETGQEGWTDAMKQSFDAFKDYLGVLKEQKQRVNPAIEITDEMKQLFLTQAKTELGGQFKQLFTQVETDLGTSFERIAQDYKARREQLGEQFGKTQEQTQASFARRGLEFTTGADSIKQAEADLAKGAQRELSGLEASTFGSAADIGTKGERRIGFSEFQKVPVGSIGTGGGLMTGAGQYGLTGTTGSRALFSPTAGTRGSLEQEQTSAEKLKQLDYINAEKELRAAKTT